MFDTIAEAQWYTCSFEACCDRGEDGVPDRDALPVCIVGMQ